MLIFAPSSETEQKPGTGGYNTEMPDADKADRQIIGDKLKAYEQAAMEERLEERDHAVRQLGDMFDRETEMATTSTSPLPKERKTGLPHRPSGLPQPPTAT